MRALVSQIDMQGKVSKNDHPIFHIFLCITALQFTSLAVWGGTQVGIARCVQLTGSRCNDMGDKDERRGMRAEWDEEEAGSGGEGMTKPEAI